MFDFIGKIGTELLKKISELDTLPAIATLAIILFFIGATFFVRFFWNEIKVMMKTMADERHEYNVERKAHSEKIVELVEKMVEAIHENANTNKEISANVQKNNELITSLKNTNDKLIETLMRRA